MKRLSKEAEESLLEAVGEVASLVSDGSDPTDAVIKVASAHGLPPGHIQLVTNAFNTGRTNAHRKSAESVWDRAEEFPLADAARAIDAIYKTAKNASTHTSDEYNSPPHWAARKTAFAKTASVVVPPMSPKPAPLPQTEELAVKKAEAATRNAARELDQARGLVSEAFDNLQASTANLHTYFRSPGHVPFMAVRKVAEDQWGEPAKAVFNYLCKKDPTLEKQAATQELLSVSGEPFNLLSQCLLNGDMFSRRRAAYEKVAAANKGQEGIKPHKRIEHILDVPSWSDSTPSQTKAAKAGEEDRTVLRPFRKEGYGAVPSLLGLDKKVPSPIASFTTPGPGSPAKPELLAWELSSPEHEHDLRSIQTNAWLQDMMTHDQVVGKHHPVLVANAYNELSKLAPRAMSNPLVAKMMLGTYLSQGGRVGLFDAQGGLAQLLEVENKLKQRDAYPQNVDPFSGPTMPVSTMFR